MRSDHGLQSYRRLCLEKCESLISLVQTRISVSMRNRLMGDAEDGRDEGVGYEKATEQMDTASWSYALDCRKYRKVLFPKETKIIQRARKYSRFKLFHCETFSKTVAV